MNAATFAEIRRITLNVTVFCALGAALLGGVFVATNRYQEAARKRSEDRAIAEMLHLDPATSRVLAISQFLRPEDSTILYRVAAAGSSAPAKELRFTMEGEWVRADGTPAASDENTSQLKPLGRLFVATDQGQVQGFVIEGEARGYKNRIIFFVALDAEFTLVGVRVLEHEEDPGLGAEVATNWFRQQYVGRTLEELPSLEVTRDPMPEDWSQALRQLDRMTPGEWESRYGDLAARESKNEIYAITGATISSRALTEGIQSAVAHFQYRWSLLSPHVGEML